MEDTTACMGGQSTLPKAAKIQEQEPRHKPWNPAPSCSMVLPMWIKPSRPDTPNHGPGEGCSKSLHSSPPGQRLRPGSGPAGVRTSEKLNLPSSSTLLPEVGGQGYPNTQSLGRFHSKWSAETSGQTDTQGEKQDKTLTSLQL